MRCGVSGPRVIVYRVRRGGWRDKTLFAEAYWHQQLASERAERARELLRSDLVEGFEVLVAIVRILDDDADLAVGTSV